jgi:hypothetical protein
MFGCNSPHHAEGTVKNMTAIVKIRANFINCVFMLVSFLSSIMFLSSLNCAPNHVYGNRALYKPEKALVACQFSIKTTIENRLLFGLYLLNRKLLTGTRKIYEGIFISEGNS